MKMKSGAAIQQTRERERKWRENNKEHLREYYKRYRSEHAELRVYHADYYRANRGKWAERSRTEQKRLYQEEWFNRHPGYSAERNKRRRDRDVSSARERERNYRARTADNKRQKDRLYRRANPDKCREVIKKSKAKKPELYRDINNARDLRRRSRVNSLPTETVVLSDIVNRDCSICHLCRLCVLRSDRSFDHLIPVVRGGRYASWNLMLAHRKCNQRRGTRQILPMETETAARDYSPPA